MRHLPLMMLAAAPASIALPAAAQDLTVYTYDSFISEWGPGPEIERRFEAACDCDLAFVAAGDGAALLSRLQLEGEGSDADVVLGLDNGTMARARATGLFASHGVEGARLDLPVEWSDDTFLPYDWGHLAFVHRADTVPPVSLAELAGSDLRVVLQDPRSSTPGLGLALWVDAVAEDPAATWAALADNVVTVTKGWSEAYGLFLEGEADMVLSYRTSPAYHAIAEEDDGFAAAQFEEGNWLQVEVAARLAGSDAPELAQQFLSFMVSESFQDVIPQTNWMHPAISLEGGLPEAFGDAYAPEATLYGEPGEDEARAAIDAFLTGLAR